MMEELDWCSIFVEKASWLGTPFDEKEIRKSEFDCGLKHMIQIRWRFLKIIGMLSKLTY